jgi:hypothetical protein
MDTIKLGYVHLPRSRADLLADPEYWEGRYGPYAYATYRVWYMPWRWVVYEIHYNKPDVVLASNVSAAAAKGLLKILGVYPHQQL